MPEGYTLHEHSPVPLKKTTTHHWQCPVVKYLTHVLENWGYFLNLKFSSFDSVSRITSNKKAFLTSHISQIPNYFTKYRINELYGVKISIINNLIYIFLTILSLFTVLPFPAFNLYVPPCMFMFYFLPLNFLLFLLCLLCLLI